MIHIGRLRSQALFAFMSQRGTQLMIEAPIIPNGTGPSQFSWKPSELLANYDRLLRLYTDELQKDEFNPYQPMLLLLLKSFSPSFQKRFWKHAAPILKVPNALRQDLVGGAVIFQEIERLSDQTLRGIAECNRINYRRLLQRSVFGWMPKIAGTLGLVLAAAKTLKESVGVDIFAALPSAVRPSLIGLAAGLLLGSAVNLVLSLPSLLQVRALDDLIAITVALRGRPKPEQ
jgi:hypothetical protein